MKHSIEFKKKRLERLKKIKNKKKQKKQLEREVNILWHLAGLKKWGDRCFFEDFYSEKRAKEHQRTTSSCHHYFRKGLYPHLRFNIDNAVPVCWSCHYRMEKVDITMASDIRRIRGEGWYNALLELSRQKLESSFQTIEYYQEQIRKLKEFLYGENNSLS